MLAKKFRLTHREFLQAKKTGKSFSSQSFSVVIAPNTQGYCRFAVVTSTKLSKKAVVRNRLRRKLYDMLGKISGSHDVLIFPKSSVLNLEDAQLNSQIDSLLSAPPGLA